MIIKSMLKKTIVYSLLKKARKILHEVQKNIVLRRKLKNFPKKKDKLLLILTPEYGNLGDHLIAMAIYKFLQDRLPNYSIDEIPLNWLNYKNVNMLKNYADDYKYVVVSGGGFLGNLYLRVEILFRKILRIFSNAKVIVFPQSVYFTNDKCGFEEMSESKRIYNTHKSLKLFIRDKSYHFVKERMLLPEKKVFSVPDIALHLNYSSANVKVHDKVMLCFRNDKEKTDYDSVKDSIKKMLNSLNVPFYDSDTVVNYEIPILRRDSEISKKIAEFNSASLVITDRLHGLIFSVITGTPCICFDNTTKKISGVYSLWLKDFPYIEMIDKDNALSKDKISYFLELGKQKYSPEIFNRSWKLIGEAFYE